MRVAVISHGHPQFTRGGGEVAAYNLFNGINATGKHRAWFLARAPQALLHPGTSVAQHRENEYLFAGEAEVENLVATIDLGPNGDFASLLKRIEPDVIHFHHYYKVGIELLRVARQACPNARLMLTFHEYMAICTNHGTMVKADMQLCHRYDPRECMHCFPDRDPGWFFLRERYLKSFFALVDLFISPSHFLAQRYIDWGLPAHKMHVIENGIAAGNKLPPRKIPAKTPRTRFAFFGQAHPFKGLDLVLEAFGALPPKLRRTVSLDIHAHGIDLLDDGPYKEKLKALLKQHRDFAHYHGAYEQRELPRLMADTDWVLMGSVWWENSPLVIQEAWKFGRPIICPELGGMAEKVEHGKGGLLYRARDGVALRTLVEQIVAGAPPVAYEALIASLPDYTTIEAATTAHLVAYRELGERAA